MKGYHKESFKGYIPFEIYRLKSSAFWDFQAYCSGMLLEIRA